MLSFPVLCRLPPPDYSKNEYDVKWSADCWWGRDIIVYGDATLKKDHPVVAFLAKDKWVLTMSVNHLWDRESGMGGTTAQPASRPRQLGRNIAPPLSPQAAPYLHSHAPSHVPVLRVVCCRHARSLSVFREGLEAFQQRYSFLVTTSVRQGAVRR